MLVRRTHARTAPFASFVRFAPLTEHRFTPEDAFSLGCNYPNFRTSQQETNTIFLAPTVRFATLPHKFQLHLPEPLPANQPDERPTTIFHRLRRRNRDSRTRWPTPTPPTPPGDQGNKPAQLSAPAVDCATRNQNRLQSTRRSRPSSRNEPRQRLIAPHQTFRQNRFLFCKEAFQRLTPRR